MIKEAKMDDDLGKVIATDLPKGVALLADLTEDLNNVNGVFVSLREKINNGDFNTAKGLSLLELKNQSFLTYMANLAYTSLRKLSGAKIEDDPSIDRLIEMRVILERLRPLEDKLKYQIDKYLKVATEGAVSEDDPSRLKGNLDNIGSSSEDEDEEVKPKDQTKDDDDNQAYKIPKISQTPYEEDKDRESEKEKARRRALQSSTLRDALYDLTEDPEVVYNMDTLKHRAMKKRRELEAYEEDNLVRKVVSKRDRHAMNETTTLGTMGSEILGLNKMDGLYDDHDPAEPRAKKHKAAKKGKKPKGKKGKKKRKH